MVIDQQKHSKNFTEIEETNVITENLMQEVLSDNNTVTFLLFKNVYYMTSIIVNQSKNQICFSFTQTL